MRSSDYAGQNFVHALKGAPFIGNSSTIPDRGQWVALTKTNVEVCKGIFARWAQDLIVRAGFSELITLVPIPNKSALMSDPRDDFPTALLAALIADQFASGVVAAPILRWRRLLQKAREGGPRDAETLYPNLDIRPVSRVLPPVALLVDDVTTSGGHARACAAKLRIAGFNVRGLISAARTCHEQQDDPFNMPPFPIEDFYPPQ
jgi:hypothetical protein